MNWKERTVVSILIFGLVSSFLYWTGALYFSFTKQVPDYGGKYVEGVVGQPRYVNPILSLASASDRDLSTLLFSGLFGFDGDGRIVPRLAEHWSVSEDGKVYTVTLRGDAFWHDGEPVTAADVVFTVMAIQDPAYKSPLRANWQGIDVEARDDRTVVFMLKKPYAGFLEHLTVGILPKHIWDSIPTDRFTLADYNLESPIGSGPYRFFELKKDSHGNILSYDLRAFPEYFGDEPYISKLSFHFFEGEEQMIEAYSKKEIMGMAPLSSEQDRKIRELQGIQEHEFLVPRVFGVFFNPIKSEALAYIEVREALSRATDRGSLVRDALFGNGVAVSSPVLPFMEEAPSPRDIPFDSDAANRLLDEKGWVRGDDGIWKKGDVRIEFDLAVPDWIELRKTADLLVSQWESIGARVNVKVLSLSDLNQSVIRPRNYDALLYGEEMNLRPDYYSFWHSSEKGEDGLNLALFDDKDVDDTLLLLREESDPAKRQEFLSKFEEMVTAKFPAVFLYSPKMLYPVSEHVLGIDIKRVNNVSDRLETLPLWYIETKRVWKK